MPTPPSCLPHQDWTLLWVLDILLVFYLRSFHEESFRCSQIFAYRYRHGFQRAGTHVVTPGGLSDPHLLHTPSSGKVLPKRRRRVSTLSSAVRECLSVWLPLPLARRYSFLGCRPYLCHVLILSPSRVSQYSSRYPDVWTVLQA